MTTILKPLPLQTAPIPRGFAAHSFRQGAARPAAALALAGAGLAAGMSLPALSDCLDNACLDAAGHRDGDELQARAALLRRLALPQPAAAPAHAVDPGQDGRFGLCLSQLQAAWYDGDLAQARHAAQRVAALAGPLTPAADRMVWHLFAALTLAASPPGGLDAVRRHCAALHALAGACRHAIPMAALSSALLDRCTGDAVGAMRGFERAFDKAVRNGQHWIVGLAAEQAAAQAGDSGLPIAARHYRRRALDSWTQWGARGRAEALRLRWNEADTGDAARTGTGMHEPGHGQRADAVGVLGLSIAHEVNQPLAVIALHAAAARKWLRRTEPDLGRALASLAMVSEASAQTGAIVHGMRRLAAGHDIERAELDVDDAVAASTQALARHVRRCGIDLQLAPGLDRCTVRANRVQLRQVVTNLVMNAVEAFAGIAPDSRGAAGAPCIRVSTGRRGEGTIEIVVADNGPGIVPADRARVFGCLFSTKQDGSGMGLPISLAIAQAHGGDLLFEPGEPHGACFRLELPCKRGEAS